MTIQRPAVFLDRDGTLNEMVFDADHGIVDSPMLPEQLVLRRQAAPFVRALNRLGYLCIVVTNQPGVAKGKLTLERLDRIHEKLRADLAAGGASLDEVLACPHHPDPGPNAREPLAVVCECRKPAPGLLLDAADRYRIDLSRSFMVGDGLTDVQAGRRAGVTTILVTKLDSALFERIDADPSARPDRFVVDLDEALAFIMQRREEAMSGGT